jgi:hypothetical protein
MKQIKTSSGSSYMVDEASFSFIRIRGEGADELGNDLSWVTYERINEVTVGRPMEIYYTPVNSEMVTLRITTPVVSIEDTLPPDEPVEEIQEDDFQKLLAGFDRELEE